MDWSSGFFATPSDSTATSSGSLELVHSSGNGWFEIYRGVSEGRYRAYKVLKEVYRDQPMFRDLLKKEYEIGAELDHPNIRRYIRYFRTESLGPAIEMEWVDGVTLDKYTASGRKEAEQIICELCDALAYMHSKQVIHCDIKPSNLLVTHNGSNLKLIDFGFSDSDNFALMKTAAGTLNYASPEQLEGRPVDSRTDIYSLGIVMREFIPWKKRIARRCTSKDREKRFQSAKDVKTAMLRNVLPILAAVSFSVAALIIAGAILRNNRKAYPETRTEISKPDTSDISIEDIFDEATKIILEVSGE